MQTKTAAKRKQSASAAVVPARRPAIPAPPAIYALRIWSVKKVNGEWFISQAARFGWAENTVKKVLKLSIFSEAI